MKVPTYRSRGGAHWAQPRWVLGDGNPVVHCLRAAGFLLLLPLLIPPLVATLLALLFFA